jgi:clan AA aspartic protease
VVWIDTAFNGFLVLPRTVISSLGFIQDQSNYAILADGSQVKMDSYFGQIDWFGNTYTVEVIAADGTESLLGIGLLLGHQLHIDYVNNTLTLI